jgi:hypothetical protein
MMTDMAGFGMVLRQNRSSLGKGDRQDACHNTPFLEFVTLSSTVLGNFFNGLG